MSASAKDVQTTGLENTLNNEAKFKFITQNWLKTFNQGMWTKIKPKRRRNGAKYYEDIQTKRKKFKIKMASSSSPISKMQPKSF